MVILYISFFLSQKFQSKKVNFCNEVLFKCCMLQNSALVQSSVLLTQGGLQTDNQWFPAGYNGP